MCETFARPFSLDKAGGITARSSLSINSISAKHSRNPASASTNGGPVKGDWRQVRLLGFLKPNHWAFSSPNESLQHVKVFPRRLITAFSASHRARLQVRLLGFLNPNDRLYFSARQKAVTVSDYSLRMTLVPPCTLTYVYIHICIYV